MKPFDPAQEISFEGDEGPSQDFRSHMLDAFAHAAGHGAHPGRYRKPRLRKKKKEQRESLEEFSKRVGTKYIREKGGQQFGAYPGGNLLPKRPKKASKG